MSLSELPNVSRETIEKLRTFEELIRKWSPKINLISKSNLDQVWDRHIVDSMQIFQTAPPKGYWIDIGSGGGFPGIVVAAISQGTHSNHRFSFVESDQRKCAFLRTALRELDLKANVYPHRIEDIDPQDADIMSARALADLSTLLQFAQQHLNPTGVALFLKGATWEKEHKAAQDRWSYSCEAIKSVTNPDAAVLKIQDIARV